MSTQEKARKLMVKERQQEEHLQESMLSRAAEVGETHPVEEEEAKARELMVEERKQEEYLQETMLSRAEAEIQ